MGAHQSRKIRRREIDLDNIVDLTDKQLGDLDLFEKVDFKQESTRTNNFSSIHYIVVNLKEQFENAFKKSLRNYDKHVKLNNLQFNYKEKNKVILQDLKNKLRLQEDEIKENKEDNYKFIRQARLTEEEINEGNTTQKYLIIILVIILLINLGIIGLFVKRKYDTGLFISDNSI
tara:strand:+ start:191 stop:712 length:522 start_codon:yes stop_codon:yes gene_type:complete